MYSFKRPRPMARPAPSDWVRPGRGAVRTRSTLFAGALVLVAMSIAPAATVDARPPELPTSRDVETRLRDKSPGLVELGGVAGSRRLTTVNQLATTPSVNLTPCTDDPGVPGPSRCRSIAVAPTAGPSRSASACCLTATRHRRRATRSWARRGAGMFDDRRHGFFHFLLDPLLDDRDLLLIDNRGTGTSAPIDCPAAARRARATTPTSLRSARAARGSVTTPTATAAATSPSTSRPSGRRSAIHRSATTRSRTGARSQPGLRGPVPAPSAGHRGGRRDAGQRPRPRLDVGRAPPRGARPDLGPEMPARSSLRCRPTRRRARGGSARRPRPWCARPR